MQATHVLVTQTLPTAARRLVARPPAKAAVSDAAALSEILAEIHALGVNFRYLGTLRRLVTPRTRARSHSAAARDAFIRCWLLIRRPLWRRCCWPRRWRARCDLAFSKCGGTSSPCAPATTTWHLPR
jgi:hypothetical protein